MDASHSLSTACSCVWACVCACACANFVGLREEEVARRWDINWPILHLCFPSGPDEQLQSLSTDVKRIKMGKLLFAKTSQCEVKWRRMMAQWEPDTTSTRAKKFWNYCFRKQNFTFFAVASCVCFRTATLVAVCPVQRYTSSIVLTGQLRARRLRPRKSITYSLDKNQLNKLRWRIDKTT